MTARDTDRKQTSMIVTAGVICLTLASFAKAAAQPAPSVVSGKIDSQVLHVGALPVAPEITLDLRGEIYNETFIYDDPSGQPAETNFSVNATDGKHTFIGYGGFTLPPYAQAGTWTLASVQVCAVGNTCSTYTGTALTALFPSLTFRVINPHSDVTAPVINSARIATPTVVATNDAAIKVVANMQAGKSGVVYADVTFQNQAATSTIDVGGGLDYPITSPASYSLVSYCVCRRTPPSTYTAVKVTLYSAANTPTIITDSATISSLFGGQPTFSLTN